MIPAVASASRNRGDASPGCPSGAPPSTTRPVAMYRNVPSDAVAARFTGRASSITHRDGDPPGVDALPGGLRRPVRARPPAPARPAGAAALARPAPWHRLGRWQPSWRSLAGFTRFWGLGFPNQKIFDEAYYPVEAQELLRFGYEDNRGYMFIVHPPLGKWLIGWSTDLFGNGLNDAFGWRVAPAFFGSLTVLLTFAIARRLFRSNLFAAIAGGLILVDGLSLVLARTAILDVFLQFFVLAGFGALVFDRDQMRAPAGRAARRRRGSGQRRPVARPASVAAARRRHVRAGVRHQVDGDLVLRACSWLLSLLWDRGAFKVAGVNRRTRVMLRRSWLPSLGSLGVVPVAVYLFSYLGWFVGENGWNRHWADTHSATTHLHVLGMSIPFWWAWVPGPIRSLGAYTLDAYRFHEDSRQPHAYGSSPWSWLVLGRPVDFYYNSSSHACGSTACSREVLLIGTPLLWWAFVPMLLWLAWHYSPPATGAPPRCGSHSWPAGRSGSRTSSGRCSCSTWPRSCRSWSSG